MDGMISKIGVADFENRNNSRCRCGVNGTISASTPFTFSCVRNTDAKENAVNRLCKQRCCTEHQEHYNKTR